MTLYLLKTSLALFLVAWIGFGGWMMWKFAMLFGPHPDDPAESAGARYYGVTHVASVWFGTFALTFYFLFCR